MDVLLPSLPCACLFCPFHLPPFKMFLASPVTFGCLAFSSGSLGLDVLDQHAASLQINLTGNHGAPRDCDHARLHCFVRLVCQPILSILLSRSSSSPSSDRWFLSLKMMAPPSSWVHLTCGSLHHLRAFFWLRVFPAHKHCPRPPTRR
jgi:hypothetical protein